MKKFWYRFLVIVLAFGLMTPMSLGKIWSPTKAEAAVIEVVDQGFDSGITAPPGWIFSGITGTYASASNYGVTSPSLKFDSTGDQITTPTFSNADSLSFWSKGVSTDSISSLLIEYYRNGFWEVLSTLNPIPNPEIVGNYPLVSGTTQLRFTYTKSTGNLALDDVLVTYNDVTPPTITGVNNDGLYNTSVTIDASDDYAIDSLLLNGEPFTTGTTISVDGEYNLVATDIAGNVTNLNFTIDTVSPVIDSNTSSPNTTGDETTITVSVSDSGSGIAYIGISVNGSNYNLMNPLGGSDFAFYYVLPFDSLNPVYYTIRVRDIVGNETISDPVSVIRPIDNDNPYSLQANPAAGGYLKAQNVVLTAEDNIGIIAIYYTLDGTKPSDGNGTLYSLPIPVDKNLMLKAVAYDAAGNKSDVLVADYLIAPIITNEGASAITTVAITTSQAPAVVAALEAPTPQITQTPAVIEQQPPIEQGQIKGTEIESADETEKVNWTPWIILFILIILAGAATGGYFYWFGKDEEEIISEEVVEKSRKSAVKTSNKKTTEGSSARKKNRW